MTDDREWAEDGEIDLFKGVLFLWRFRYLLIALPLLCAFIAWLSAAWLMDKRYTASAGLVIVPAALSNLLPDPTDVDAVERLAGSGAIHAEVETRLGQEQRLSGDQRVMAYTTTAQKSLDPARPTVSFLTLSVSASNPELAQQAANLWAETVAREEAALAEGKRKAALSVFEAQYEDAAARLVERQRAFDEARKRRDADSTLASAELDNAKADFKRAGKRRDEAQFVMADRAPSVQRAVLPTGASGPRVGRIVVFAAAAGFALALFIGWVYSRLSAATGQGK